MQHQRLALIVCYANQSASAANHYIQLLHCRASNFTQVTGHVQEIILALFWNAIEKITSTPVLHHKLLQLIIGDIVCVRKMTCQDYCEDICVIFSKRLLTTRILPSLSFYSPNKTLLLDNINSSNNTFQSYKTFSASRIMEEIIRGCQKCTDVAVNIKQSICQSKHMFLGNTNLCNNTFKISSIVWLAESVLLEGKVLYDKLVLPISRLLLS